VGITEFIALVGALVGGITARQRKAELERLNEQLRKINMSLRQQARAGTVYAPGGWGAWRVSLAGVMGDTKLPSIGSKCTPISFCMAPAYSCAER
jgi:hypothetical protein